MYSVVPFRASSVPGGGGVLPYQGRAALKGMVFQPSAHKQGLKFKDFQLKSFL